MKLLQELKDSDYTTGQQWLAGLFAVILAVVYGVVYWRLGWTWPPVCVSIAKGVSALAAAYTALISVVKEDMQDKLDALKDKAKASSDDSVKYSNDSAKYSKSIKSCRIWQLCSLTVAFAAAVIAI